MIFRKQSIFNLPIILWALSFLISCPLLAQNSKKVIIISDTAIKPKVLEIEQIFKPKIKSKPKEIYLPTDAKMEQQNPVYNYNLPQQLLNYTYHSLPFHPMALKPDYKQYYNDNYIKLGYGTQHTLAGEIGLGFWKNKNLNTAFLIRHFSQKGDINGQTISQSSIQGDINYLSKQYLWHSQLLVSRNAYHFYGFDHQIYPYDIDTLKQRFVGVSAEIDLVPKTKMLYGFTYHPAVEITSIADKNKMVERGFKIELPFQKNIDSNVVIGIKALADLSVFSIPHFNYTNTLFQLPLFTEFKAKNNYLIHFGLTPSLGNGISYLLPDINLKCKINNQIGIQLGWLASLHKNTEAELVAKNPYLQNDYIHNQTKKNEVYLKGKLQIKEKWEFYSKIAWLKYNNLPEFMNVINDSKRFNLVYDQVNALAIVVGAEFHLNTKFVIAAEGNWMNYYKSNNLYVWHEPGLILNTDLKWQLNKNIKLNAYSRFMDQIYALNNTQQIAKIKGSLDMGLGGDYRIWKELYIYLQINNLFNSKVQRWLNYPGIGTNILGGLHYHF